MEALMRAGVHVFDGRQDFHGDVAVKVLVVSAKHHAHAPGTNLFENAVMGESSLHGDTCRTCEQIHGSPESQRLLLQRRFGSEKYHAFEAIVVTSLFRDLKHLALERTLPVFVNWDGGSRCNHSNLSLTSSRS